IGVKVVEGYGLTETAPVVAVRPIRRPIFGTVGSPIRGVSVRVVSLKNGEDVGKCKVGVLQVKGGTVMKGYYKRPDLTAAAIDENEWFNTGDIAILTRHNEIVLRGRAKDTIVQRGGENVEPLPIEMKIQESRYVQTAVLVGQDQRYLAALIVPEQSELEGFAKENNIEYKNYKELFSNPQVIQLFDTEIAERINSKNGFKMFERVNKFCLLEKPFEVGVELSAKQEIMRYRISEIYSKEIKALFKD
nr:AMP-binding protein [Treponemataceae bacterium]